MQEVQTPIAQDTSGIAALAPTYNDGSFVVNYPTAAVGTTIPAQCPFSLLSNNNVLATQTVSLTPQSQSLNMQAGGTCSITGNWQGTFVDDAGESGSMTGTISQTNSTITGSTTIFNAQLQQSFTSSFTGTVSNNQVTFRGLVFGQESDTGAGTISNNCTTISGRFVGSAGEIELTDILYQSDREYNSTEVALKFARSKSEWYKISVSSPR